MSSIIDELEAAAEVRSLSTQEIGLKIVLMWRWRVTFVKRRSSGTNDLRPNLFWKEMRIRDTFIVLLMEDIERNSFTH